MDKNSWAMYLDIEGFSTLYEENEAWVYNILHCLSKDIFKIGTEIYPKCNNCLFVNQIGDGFIITSRCNNDLHRPVFIAISLMRSTQQVGGYLKVAIDYGEMKDIQEIIPKSIKDDFQNKGIVNLGYGYMTILSLMGDGLIRCAKL